MHTTLNRNNSIDPSSGKKIRPSGLTVKPLSGAMPTIQRKSCACGGSCPSCQTDSLQTKLAISKPTDSYEQEADRVADKIVSGNSNAEENSVRKTLNVSSLQRQAASNTKTNSVPSSVFETLNQSGQPLASNTRSEMEPHFGKDFSNVRVHTGAQAAESSRDVNAKAYTVGTDIVFNDNQYSPGTKEGNRLIAHELTHVVQQNGDLSRSILQRDEMEAPVPLDEEEDSEVEGEEDEDEDEGDSDEGDSEEGSEEDEVEDGDVDVPDLVEYPEMPELPDHIERDPLPIEPPEEGTELQDQKPIMDENTGAEEMKGGGSKKTRKIKEIKVNQVTQEMTIIFTSGSPKKHPISTGRGRCGTKEDPCKSQNSKNCTPNSSSGFTIVSQGNANTKNSHGDAMAWFVGLATPGRKGIGIHNSQPVPGWPASHGCVRTGTSAQDGGVAEMINKGVTYGTTKVIITGKANTKPYACKKKKKDKDKDKKKKKGNKKKKKKE